MFKNSDTPGDINSLIHKAAAAEAFFLSEN